MRIPIFWLADLYQVILGCDETISLTSLSCNSHGVNSTHHCHYAMASANSKFDNSICQIQTPILLLMMQFIKPPKKQLIGEYLFWKVTLQILNFSFKLF